MNHVLPTKHRQQRIQAADGNGHARQDGSNQQRQEPGQGKRALANGLERGAIRRMLKWIGDPPLNVVLYGGQEIAAPVGAPVASVQIDDRRTLWRLAADPIYEFAEAYAAGRIDVQGDLTELLLAVFRSFDQRKKRRSLAARLLYLLRRPRANTLAKSRGNITHHYDLGNDFYRLWLDDQLVYTCAYFSEPTLTLEEAQVAKFDHVCRKLRLRPGQTVLEAGCGWGTFALHMARQYGVTVKAFNISHEQIMFARQQAQQSGLGHRVEFVEDDWRNMHQPCDVFVSVGMLEHIGVQNYRLLGDVIHRCLKPNGCGLIHAIGQNFAHPVNPWIERRIFPGAYPPSLRQMMDVFEPHDFSVLDVENLRLHYALTLRHWLERFERAVDTVRQMFDERFVRMWRFYLASSIAAFETGGLQLFQVLFARGVNDQIPWTREALYVDHGSRRSTPARYQFASPAEPQP
jgi:cyclopropane-fatty-acyl-phospholipid synthase